MSLGAAIRRVLALPVAALALGSVWYVAPARADDAAPAAKKEEKAAGKLSPEIEAKLTELFKKMTEAKRKAWVVRMKKELDEIGKAAALSPEELKALQTSSEKAIGQSVEDMSAKMDKEFRQQVQQMPVEILPVIEQSLLQVDAMAEQAELPGVVEPFDEPVWMEALKQTLTQDQAAAWDKVLADRKDAIARETGDLLKGMKERMRAEYEHGIAGKITGIEDALAPFPKDRASQLEAVAKEAVNKSMEAWQKFAESQIMAMPAAARKQMVGAGNFYFGRQEGSAPEQQAVWTEGLGKILSAEEQKKLADVQEEHKQRRVHIMGHVLISVLDEKIAFTAKEREQLEPIAERLVKDQSALFPEPDSNSYMNYPYALFYAAGSKADENELRPIVDAVQWKHWKETCNAVSNEENQADFNGQNAPPPKPVEPRKTAQPEDLEHGISDYLQELSGPERKRDLSNMLLKAEDAARVAHLSQEVSNRLQTAARGTAEKTLQGWKSMTEQNLRSNLSDATPQNVKQRLAAMQGQFGMFRQNGGETPKQTLWDKTLKAEMTDEQRAAWKLEMDARQQYAHKAVTSVILAEFDRVDPLKPDQWAKLDPLVAKIIEEYAPDIQGYFAYSSGIPWYLQYYSKFIPIVAIPEKELKTILSKEQWDCWTGTNEFGNSTNYWENLKQNHERRVKAK